MSNPPTPLSDKIFRRYKFRLPETYWEFLARGCIEFTRSDTGEVTLGNNFVWLFEMEFHSPQVILAHEFLDPERSDFVSFAHTGGGDSWCWQSEKGGRVVLCPHDSNMAKVYAKNFESALFRQALDYANGGFDEEDEDDARENLKSWPRQLSFLWPAKWGDELTRIAVSPLQVGRFSTIQLISDEDLERLVEQELSFEGIDEEFKWME